MQHSTRVGPEGKAHKFPVEITLALYTEQIKREFDPYTYFLWYRSGSVF